VRDNETLVPAEPMSSSGVADEHRKRNFFLYLKAKPRLKRAEIDLPCNKVFILDVKRRKSDRQFGPTYRQPVPMSGEPSGRVDTHVRTAVVHVIPTRIGHSDSVR
jgi:hypothetical protein